MEALSKYETETTIIYNDAEKEAMLYTCNKALLRKMDRLCESKPDIYKQIREDKYSKTYLLSKKLISIRTPRILSEEQKQKLQERGANIKQKSPIETQ